MHKKFKTLLLILTAIIVVLTVLAGLTLAADNSPKLAAALPSLTNLSKYLHNNQYLSYLKDIALIVFLFLLLLLRVLLLRKSQD